MQGFKRQRGGALRRIQQSFDPRRKTLRRSEEHQPTVASANFPNEQTGGAGKAGHPNKIAIVTQSPRPVFIAVVLNPRGTRSQVDIASAEQKIAVSARATQTWICTKPRNIEMRELFASKQRILSTLCGQRDGRRKRPMHTVYRTYGAGTSQNPQIPRHPKGRRSPSRWPFPVRGCVR